MWHVYDYYASNGGIINAAIFITAVITLFIGSGKLIQYRHWTKRLADAATNPPRIAGMPLYMIAPEPGAGCRRKYYENYMREVLLELYPLFESGLDTMAAMIQAAPLLGLFGTVVGMIKTFSLITTYGTANPVILTEGITVSLLTTQAGLLVAFPCMLFHTYVTGKKNALIQELAARAEEDVNNLVCKQRGENV